jgi:hypothetical protein
MSTTILPFPAGTEIECACGNRPDLDGFSAAAANGTLMCDEGRNPFDEWDGIHYVCDSCDQMWAQAPATE